MWPSILALNGLPCKIWTGVMSEGLVELLKMDILQATNSGRCANGMNRQLYGSVRRNLRVPCMTARIDLLTCGVCVHTGS